MKKLQEKPEEIFLDSIARDEEERIWSSSRPSMEEVLLQEGLAIYQIFDWEEMERDLVHNKSNRHQTRRRK